jgi:hypothetical protein
MSSGLIWNMRAYPRLNWTRSSSGTDPGLLDPDPVSDALEGTPATAGNPWKIAVGGEMRFAVRLRED